MSEKQQNTFNSKLKQVSTKTDEHAEEPTGRKRKRDFKAYVY
jgi:hypothetical protein